MEIQTLITQSRSGLRTRACLPAQIEVVARHYAEVTDRGPGGHILTGPVYIEGAEPGDMLEVRIQKIELAIPYAYNAFGPGRGFMPDDFPYARRRSFRSTNRKCVAHFAPGIDIPLHPFFGSMGVAPPGRRPHQQRPARDHGGNMDNKELVAGTTLYLPVHAAARCLRSATAMPARATAKSTSPRWRRR